MYGDELPEGYFLAGFARCDDDKWLFPEEIPDINVRRKYIIIGLDEREKKPKMKVLATHRQYDEQLTDRLVELSYDYEQLWVIQTVEHSGVFGSSISPAIIHRTAKTDFSYPEQLSRPDRLNQDPNTETLQL